MVHKIIFSLNRFSEYILLFYVSLTYCATFSTSVMLLCMDIIMLCDYLNKNACGRCYVCCDILQTNLTATKHLGQRGRVDTVRNCQSVMPSFCGHYAVLSVVNCASLRFIPCIFVVAANPIL